MSGRAAGAVPVGQGGGARRERGILFDGEMVRAVLADEKTETRRVVRPQPKHRLVEPKVGLTVGMDPADDGGVWYDSNGVEPGVPVRPPYRPLDRLYVRETWRVARSYDALPPRLVEVAMGGDTAYCVDYRANEYDSRPFHPPSPDIWGPWRPSIFMPKSFARIWLEVISVRAERLHAIDVDGLIAEGVDLEEGPAADAFNEAERYVIAGVSTGFRYPEIAGFAYLWDRLNARRGFGWERNPWVWVYSFRRVS